MNNIKEFRTNSGMTVRKLAKESNVAIGYISALENNKSHNPSMEVMTRIATALEKTVVQVFFEDINN